MRPILLNPGPVSLSEGVRHAVTSQDLCHREPEFFNLQDRVIEGLLGVYECNPVDWSAVLVGGSGTFAMEAMVSSLIPADANILVLENGVYGERLSKIANIYQLRNQALQAAWGDEVDLVALNELLQSGEFSHVLAVHHETTTGRLNPAKEIAALCSTHGVKLLLDAVSSFGAESIPFEETSLQAVAATANKCLHGIPGLAMVVCRAESLQQGIAARTLSLHLPAWAEQQAKQSTPFTPSVNAILGLNQALNELKQQGGWKVRRQRYRQLATMVAETLTGMRVRPWMAAEDSSCVLRSYHLPDGLSYNVLHDGLKRSGFIIYAGQGDFSSCLFRVSTMGEISDDDIARLQQAFKSVIAA